MSAVESSQVSYGQAHMNPPTYKFLDSPPQNNGQNIYLGAAQVPVIIPISPEIWNLYESLCLFSLVVPRTSIGANNYLWMRSDVWSGLIQHIQHYQTAAGDGMLDLDGLQNYLQISMKKETSLTDLLTLDQSNGFYASNSMKTVVPALQPSYVVGATPNPSFKDNTEPAYYWVSGVGDNAAIAGDNVVIKFTLPLRLIKNSVCSVNKDFISGKTTYLKLFFAPLNKFGFLSTSNVSPSAAAQVDLTTLAANSVYISPLNLKLAVQQNPVCRATIMKKASAPGGLRYAIPYVHMYNEQYSGARQNGILKIDNAYGNTITKLYYGLWNNTETNLTAYDNCNYSDDPNICAGKVQTFQTKINGEPLQIDKMDCTAATGDFTDYHYMKPQFKNSVIQSRQQYQQNWFWCEEFGKQPTEYEQEDGSSIVYGRMLSSTAFNYNFDATVVSATYQHYAWGVFMRDVIMDGVNIIVPATSQ